MAVVAAHRPGPGQTVRMVLIQMAEMHRPAAEMAVTAELDHQVMAPMARRQAEAAEARAEVLGGRETAAKALMDRFESPMTTAPLPL